MRADYRFSPKSAAIFVLTLRDNYNNNNYPKMKKILSITVIYLLCCAQMKYKSKFIIIVLEMSSHILKRVFLTNWKYQFLQ